MAEERNVVYRSSIILSGPLGCMAALALPAVGVVAILVGMSPLLELIGLPVKRHALTMFFSVIPGIIGGIIVGISKSGIMAIALISILFGGPIGALFGGGIEADAAKLPAGEMAVGGALTGATSFAFAAVFVCVPVRILCAWLGEDKPKKDDERFGY